MRKLKYAEVKGVREQILHAQGHRCAICAIQLPTDEAVLDHCHVSGAIRGALCRNCNGIEGKVHNLARRAKRQFTAAWWVERLLSYWATHEVNPTSLMHPTHKTAEDKRLARNKAARDKRAATKST